MANELGVVEVLIEGFVGAPGLMQFHFQGGTPGVFSPTDATAAIAAVHTFLGVTVGVFPSTTTCTVQTDCKVIDWTTGTLVGMVTGAGVAVVNNALSGNILTAEGCLVRWNTATVVNGRLLKGRTFLVPTAAGGIVTNGTISAATALAVRIAGDALAATAAVTLSVWHRPAPGGAGGTVGAVISASVPTKVCVLRSRRD